MIDFEKAFKTTFADRDWINKTLEGLLWHALVVTAPAVYGVQMERIRRVARGDDSLPEWDDFGKKWADGFMVWLALFVYRLPLMILSSALFVLLIVLMIVAFASGNRSDAAASLAFGSTMGLYLFAMAFAPINSVYNLALGVFFRAAMVNYAMTQRFSAFFEFRKVVDLMRGKTGYWIVWFYGVAIGAAGGVAVYLLGLSYVGVFLVGGVSYLMQMMNSHLNGQWAAVAFGDDSARGAEPPAPPTMPAPPVLPAPPAPTAPPAPPAPPAPTDPLVGAGGADDQPR